MDIWESFGEEENDIEGRSEEQQFSDIWESFGEEDSQIVVDDSQFTPAFDGEANIKNMLHDLDGVPINQRGETYQQYIQRKKETGDDFETDVEDEMFDKISDYYKAFTVNAQRGVEAVAEMLNRYSSKTKDGLSAIRDIWKKDYVLESLSDEEKEYYKSQENVDAIKNMTQKMALDFPVAIANTVEQASSAIDKIIETNEVLPQWEQDVAESIKESRAKGSLLGAIDATALEFTGQIPRLLATTINPMLGVGVVFAESQKQLVDRARKLGVSDKTIDENLEINSAQIAGLEWASDIATLATGKILGKIPFVGAKTSALSKNIMSTMTGKILAGFGVWQGNAFKEGLEEWSQESLTRFMLGEMMAKEGRSAEEIAEISKADSLFRSPDFLVGYRVGLFGGGITGISNAVVNMHKSQKNKKAWAEIDEYIKEANLVSLQEELFKEGAPTREHMSYSDAVVQEAQKRNQELEAKKDTISKLSEEDRAVVAKALMDEYDIDVSPDTLTDNRGRVPLEADVEIEDLIESRSVMNQERMSIREDEINRQLQQRNADRQIKELEDQIKKLDEREAKTTDEAERRQIIAEELEIQDQIKLINEQRIKVDEDLAIQQETKDIQSELNDAIATEELVQDVDQIEAEPLLNKEEVHKEVLKREGKEAEKLGHPVERKKDGHVIIDGKEYMLTQVKIIEHLVKSTDMTQAEAEMYYVKHFAEKFAEHHRGGAELNKIKKQVDKHIEGDEKVKLVEDPKLDTAILSKKEVVELKESMSELKTPAEQHKIDIEQRDLPSGTGEVKKAPKLSQAIKELKTDDELQRKPLGKAKDRKTEFIEIAGVRKPDKVVTTFNKIMSWLESNSTQIARGVRKEVHQAQSELAKIIRETMPVDIRGKMIAKINAIASAQKGDTRVSRVREALDYMQSEVDKYNNKQAVSQLETSFKRSKERIRKARSEERGFTTVGEGNIYQKINSLKKQNRELESNLQDDATEIQASKIKRKITNNEKIIDKLETTVKTVGEEDTIIEALEREVNKLTSIPKATYNKIIDKINSISKGEDIELTKRDQKLIADVADGKTNITAMSTKDALNLSYKLDSLLAGESIASYTIHQETKAQNDAQKALLIGEIVKNHNLKNTKKQKGGFVKEGESTVRRSHSIVAELGGGFDSIAYGATHGKVMDASRQRKLLQEEITKADKDIFESVDERSEAEKKLGLSPTYFEAIHKPITTFNDIEYSTSAVLEMYLMSKTPKGRQILENSNLSTDEKTYTDILPKRYKELGDKYLTHLEEIIYPIVNREYKRRHGLDMPKTKFYYHIMDLDAGTIETALSLGDFNSGTKRFDGGKLNDGFTQETVDHKKGMRYFDFFDKSERFKQMVSRWVGESEILEQVGSIIKDSDVQNTIRAVNSPYMDELVSWYDSVVNGTPYDRSMNNKYINSLLQLKQAKTKTVLPANIKTMLKQAGSYVTGIPVIASGGIKGLGDSITALRNPIEIGKFVAEKSVIQRNRNNDNISRHSGFKNISELKGGVISKAGYRRLAKYANNADRFSNMLFQNGIGGVDMVITNSVWYGVYQNSIRNGRGETQAIKDADLAVARTQPTFDTENLSYLNRNKFVSLMRPFSSQLDQNLNLVLDAVHGKKMGLSNKQRISQLSAVSASSIILSMISATFGYAIYSYYKDDKDEEAMSFGSYMAENLPKQIIKDQVHNVVGGVPFVNWGAEQMALIGYEAKTGKKPTYFEKKQRQTGFMGSLLQDPAVAVIEAGELLSQKKFKEASKKISDVALEFSVIPAEGAYRSYKSIAGFALAIRNKLKDGDPRKRKLDDLYSKYWNNE